MPLSEGHEALGEMLRERINPKSRILEIGVGSGLSLKFIPRSASYVGIDINEDMLSIAKEKLRKMNRKNMSIEIMNAKKLDFSESSFDIVFASSVLSAMDRPTQGFREMIRVTRPGGYIAVVANLRTEKSIRSFIAKSFDPITRKYFGFRTDMELGMFTRIKNVELVESRQVNSILGLPLSTYLLFRKIS